jgi:hypothetical protein
MLSAGECIDANIVWDLKVRTNARVYVTQRCVPLPVFRAGMGVHHERIRFRPLQYTIAVFGETIRGNRVSERVALRRPLMLFMLSGIPAHLRKTTVSKKTPGSRDVNIDGVKNFAPRRVHVESVVNKLP